MSELDEMSKLFVVGPELLGAIFMLRDFLHGKTLDPDISRSADDYVAGRLSELDLENFRRTLRRSVHLAEVKKDFLVPSLIAISSLLAGLAETDASNMPMFLALIFGGIVLVAVELAVFHNLTDHNCTKINRIHVAVTLVFLASTAAAKYWAILGTNHAQGS